MQVAQLVATVGMAFAFACEAFWTFWRRPPIAPGTFLSEAVLLLGWAILLNLVYPWFRLGYCARSATLLLLLVAAFFRALSGLRAASGIRGVLPSRVLDWVKTSAGVVMAVIIPVVAIGFPTRDAVAVQSPFSEGVWYVGQGGASPLVNHHYPILEQRFSLDLVRLDSSGRNRSGSDSSLESYAAWGSRVVAPVSGAVVSVVDGFPDVEIGKRDAENPAGNHLMLETASGARLLLCHLRRGSIAVHQGQNVEAGQVLAEVGNSGNTTTFRPWRGLMMALGWESLSRFGETSFTGGSCSAHDR